MIRRKFMAAYIVMLLFLSGCSLDGTSEKKITKKVAFEVCSYNKLPTELLKIIDEKKNIKFKVSYRNSENIYIAIGYGEHEDNELCVGINELYETNKELYVSATLYTKKGIDNSMEKDIIAKGEYSRCPYIVIKCKAVDLPVYFDVD